jgi:hypothetical protein
MVRPADGPCAASVTDVGGGFELRDCLLRV